MPDNLKEIKFWKSKFRILKDWDIIYEYDPPYIRQCSFWGPGDVKKVSIMSFGVGRQAKDYIFHEILHICQKEISYSDKKQKRETKELFVQDLCEIYLKNIKYNE